MLTTNLTCKQALPQSVTQDWKYLGLVCEGKVEASAPVAEVGGHYEERARIIRILGKELPIHCLPAWSTGAHQAVCHCIADAGPLWPSHRMCHGSALCYGACTMRTSLMRPLCTGRSARRRGYRRLSPLRRQSANHDGHQLKIFPPSGATCDISVPLSELQVFKGLSCTLQRRRKRRCPGLTSSCASRSSFAVLDCALPARCCCQGQRYHQATLGPCLSMCCETDLSQQMR